VFTCCGFRKNAAGCHDSEAQVIGEAVKNISDTATSQQPLILWKQFAGLRDKVVHDYLGVNLDVVWAGAEEDLPALGAPSINF
jgi:uncharacterized protein with HEPN domain